MIGSRHQVRNPGSILLLTRAFLIVESVLRRLDPGMNVIEVFGTELGAITAGRYAPARLAERAKRALRELDLLIIGILGSLGVALGAWYTSWRQ